MVRKLLVLATMLSMTTMMRAEMSVQKVEYKGWANCYRISNGEVELIVTGDVGPRVIRFGFVGGDNILKEFPEQIGKTGETEFQLRGGDRVWKAPEDPVATWAPDNVPVTVQITPNGVIAREPVEPLTGLPKEIEVRMADSGTEVTVLHRITNRSLFSLEYSVWALTMMAPGGAGISGFPPRGRHPAHLEATHPLAMWAYTTLSDKRWVYTKKNKRLKKDPEIPEQQNL